MKNRVVITGLGALTSIGIGTASFWNAALEGRSGTRRIQDFDGLDLNGYRSQVAAEIKGFDPLTYLDAKRIERSDRSTQFALVAAQMCIKDSVIEFGQENPYRSGVCIGSGTGGMVIGERQLTALLQHGQAHKVHPNLISMNTLNAPAGQIAIEWGLKGPNLTIATACSSGAHAIGQAFNLIRWGQADVMVAGGTEACITPLTFAGFCSLRTLSTHFNDTPEKASRPFDRMRDGFVMGEGAGMIILESLSHAERRSAKIYAEVAGWGATSEAHHMVIPEQSGREVTRTIELALEDAKVRAEQVDYINAHATSTPAGDQVEIRAIKQVCGSRAEKILINATKSMIGHTIGAAGAIGAIVCALTLQTGLVHPTINLEEIDPECALPGIRNKVQEGALDLGLVHSFGFGSNNACLVLRKIR
jgi:3-oxoacyl-[acyl-carrier-protein] synthase II